jgi:hypothetical protein
LISYDHIYESICNSVKIRRKYPQEICEKYIREHNFRIKNKIIYRVVKLKNKERKFYPVFDIDANISSNHANTEFRIYKCNNKTHCITALLYPKLKHYHGEIINEDEYSDDDIILIPN